MGVFNEDTNQVDPRQVLGLQRRPATRGAALSVRDLRIVAVQDGYAT